MERTVSIKIRKTLKELKRELIELYGERLRGVYLFGSYARGDFDSDSDVDILMFYRISKNTQPNCATPVN